ncbi:hypothetical protein Ocin01_04401 [Orchesella cincta]|uniref:Uncharacterized protein n=1 Tax=Orchesella cincta TaxID=48709 RepID=A0A1D2NAN1_ORCCI|nr:hypothetical protein Ocin01_04401 [Orchesella cincta]
MEGLILLLPVLFLSICISFIIIQSCYQRWKAGGIWKKKREAAKISLVNILQMTNPTLASPWYNIDKIPKLEKGTNGATTEKTVATKPKSGTDPFVFDPRNPNLLSSVITMKEQDDNVPPPCYHCTNSSSRLSEELILRPPSYPSLYRCSSQKLTNSRENLIVKNSRDDECACKTENKDLLQPSKEPEPSTERRNSSAVLYL